MGINSSSNILINKANGINLHNSPNFTSKVNKDIPNDSFEKNIDVKMGFAKDKLTGSYENMPFELVHKNGFVKSDLITGQINNKNVNLKFKERLFFANKINGSIGDKPLDLKLSSTFWGGIRVNGTYGDQKVKFKIIQNTLSYTIVGNNTNLKIKGKNIFSNDMSMKGQYNDDKELLPILLDIVNYDRQSI